MSQCVDYYISMLVFENFRTLKDIFNKFVTDITTRKSFVKQADAFSDFLKYGYSYHVDMDNYPFHNSIQDLVGDGTRKKRCAMSTVGLTAIGVTKIWNKW